MSDPTAPLNELATALRQSSCHRPIDGDDGTTGDCVDKGHCGCSALTALRAQQAQPELTSEQNGYTACMGHGTLKPGSLADRDFAQAYQRMWHKLDSEDHETLNVVIAMARSSALSPHYSESKWSEYKRGHGEGRANPQWQGESDGASDCAEAIRALAPAIQQGKETKNG